MSILVCLFAQISSQQVTGDYAASLIIDEAHRIEFGLEIEERETGELAAFLVNEPERIEVPEVRWDGKELVLEIAHYDSRIRARLASPSKRLEGTWERVRGKDKTVGLPFHASEEKPTDPGPIPAWERIEGRWSVDFESDAQPAVAIFKRGDAPSSLRGTFLTATGDYRYLAGSFLEGELKLSCFDGAHAFLFEARLTEDGRFEGEFFSGNWWKDTWSAVRDERAELDDPFAQTKWTSRASLADLVFLDLKGNLTSLASPEYAGRGYLLVLFGSWCPNCHDEAQLLSELDERYREQGLSILGLAFELTGEYERDRAQVELFAKRHEITFPLFIAGTADKAQATLAFGGLDAVKAFPTTVFLSADGRVRAIHSGYAGPATGAEHAALRARFESLIDELLAQKPISDEPVWQGLLEQRWSTTTIARNGTSIEESYAFGASDPTRREVVRTEHAEGSPERRTTLPVRIVGDAVWIGDRAWRFDRVAGVLLDPLRFDSRLWPEGGSRTPYLERRKIDDEAEIVDALGSPDELTRREAVVALASRRTPNAGSAIPEVLPLLDDESLDVQRAAIWAIGMAQESEGRGRLVALLQHPNAALRREAVFALLRLRSRDSSVLSDLAEKSRSDPDPLIRSAVMDALHEGDVEY